MKEKNNLTERFALYLKEVIEYYHANGSLKHFSIIAMKHKITQIPQDLFFKHGLDKMQAGNTPTVHQCKNILDDIRSRKQNKGNKNEKEIPAKKEPRFKEGSIIAYENKDGVRSISYIGEDDFVWFALNRFCKKEETDRIWIYDELPYCLKDGTWKLVEPTKEDYERFIKALSLELNDKFKREGKQKTLF